MKIEQLIAELTYMQRWVDDVFISTGGFTLSDIQDVEINHFEGQPLNAIIRVKVDDTTG